MTTKNAPKSKPTSSAPDYLAIAKEIASEKDVIMVKIGKHELPVTRPSQFELMDVLSQYSAITNPEDESPETQAEMMRAMRAVVKMCLPSGLSDIEVGHIMDRAEFFTDDASELRKAVDEFVNFDSIEAAGQAGGSQEGAEDF